MALKKKIETHNSKLTLTILPMLRLIEADGEIWDLTFDETEEAHRQKITNYGIISQTNKFFIALALEKYNSR